MTPAIEGKIILNFGWEGPSSWHGGWSQGGLNAGVVDLIFKNAKTDTLVHIQENSSPSIVKKLRFTRRRYHETECELNGRKFRPLAQETYPDSLAVTVEQIHNLTIKVGIFEESPHKGPAIMDSFGWITLEKHALRSDKEIKLEVPEALEIGQTYTLIVTSNNFSFSARLLKEEKAKDKDEEISKEELQKRMKKIGEALIAKGMQNLNLASKGEEGIGEEDVFDSFTTTTDDIFANVMQRVISLGLQMHPLESSLDLDRLSKDELQSRFEATFKKDKEFGSQRMRAAMAGNIEEMNRMAAVEYANSQLLMKLVEALERKGGKAQIPQSETFQFGTNQL